MAPLRDLTPRGDVKGGSPKTPFPPLSQADYQGYIMPANGHGVWKVLATGSFSLLLGFVVAWWTALQGRGVSQKDMQEYVERYSPYSQQKDVIANHFTNQDTQIGVLQGKQDRNYERLNKNENEIDKLNISFKSLEMEVRSKMGTVADYLEQKKAKP